MKIYTRTGDKGQTSLFNGTRVAKDHARIEVLGALDELNANIGMLLVYLKEDETNRTLLEAIQSAIFSIGAELANPQITKDDFKDFSGYVVSFESSMDMMDSHLPPLKNFILPGGVQAAAQAHICRTTTRRCERMLISYQKDITINETSLQFINRLSDYFFVLARYINKNAGVNDVIWK